MDQPITQLPFMKTWPSAYLKLHLVNVKIWIHQNPYMFRLWTQPKERIFQPKLPTGLNFQVQS